MVIKRDKHWSNNTVAAKIVDQLFRMGEAHKWNTLFYIMCDPFAIARMLDDKHTKWWWVWDESGMTNNLFYYPYEENVVLVEVGEYEIALTPCPYMEF